MLVRTSPSRGTSSLQVTGFYHSQTGSIQYVAACPVTRSCAIIDCVADFDPSAARISHDSASAILDFCQSHSLNIEWILDTHPHADHMMASSWLKQHTGAPNAVGEKIVDIAGLWRDIYHLPDAFDPAADFDRLFADGDTFRIGEIDMRVMLSPGHTLGSITFVSADAAFVHDTLMYPDFGTARADFPGGSAAQLYDSVQEILALPDDTRLFVGHDYGTASRSEPAWEATVAEHKAHNRHVGGEVTKEDYVAKREARDATLALPVQMLHALQVNLRAGKPPEPEADGHSYLKIPLNRFS